MELERESPFYEGEVPVKVEQAGADHSIVKPLTIRVIPGLKKTSQGQRIGVMHIEITQDNDLFFLYTLEVSEDEFPELKNDQSLLVDFAGFPPKFVELLEACKKPAGATTGKFIAVLDLLHSPMFRIVEANQFKQLTHLALRFQVGTDATTKEYLACRLKMSQKETQRRQTAISSLSSDLDQEKKQVLLYAKDKEELKSRLDKIESCLNSQHSTALAKHKEESVRLLAQTQNASSEQARKQQEMADKRIRELELQLDELQLQHRKIYEEKASCDADNGQLKAKVASLEKFTQNGLTELDKLRDANRELQTAKFELEKSTSEQYITIASLKQQLQQKEILLSKSSTVLEEAHERRMNAEEKVTHYKASTTKLQRKLELSIAEINKGNNVIERIQRELKQAKEKLKTKSIVIRQQEATVEELEADVEIFKAVEDRINTQLENEKMNAAELKKALALSKGKLEECNKMLESNQNIITFLNKEINEAQMGSGRIPGGALPFLRMESDDGRFAYTEMLANEGDYMKNIVYEEDTDLSLSVK